MKHQHAALFLLSVSLVMPSWLFAQSPATYFPDKQGAYSFYNNTGSHGGEYVAFGDQVKTLADYFHQNIPVMKANTGFDLKAVLFGMWNGPYTKRAGNYGVRGELRFDFQLFLKENGKAGKWTVEPPAWAFYINNTEAGHGGNLKEGNEGSLLPELFTVFPLVKEIAPGVRYYDCEPRTCGSLVVFNPDRPSFWIPVTVREVVEAKLASYKADKDNKMLYDFIKPLVDNMSEDELKAPAYFGSEDAILKVNGKGEGLQLMRFNPEYWDRALPPSAVQLITMVYSEYGYGNQNQEDQETAEREFIHNNGHPDYSQVVRNSLPIKDLSRLIARTRK